MTARRAHHGRLACFCRHQYLTPGHPPYLMTKIPELEALEVDGRTSRSSRSIAAAKYRSDHHITLGRLHCQSLSRTTASKAVQGPLLIGNASTGEYGLTVIGQDVLESTKHGFIARHLQPDFGDIYLSASGRASERQSAHRKGNAPRGCVTYES